MLGRYNDVAGVSLSDWPPLVGSGLSDYTVPFTLVLHTEQLAGK